MFRPDQTSVSKPRSVANGSILADLDVILVLSVMLSISIWTGRDESRMRGNNTEDYWNTAMNTSEVERVEEY